jgi:hypothetical protein
VSTVARLLAVALVVGACGRISFDPRDDAGAGDVVGADTLDSCAIRQLAVGERHVCALRGDGAIYCAGDNAEGQLGTGILSAAQPVAVRATELSDFPVASVHAGRQFTCVRDTAGMLFCLGDNGNRELGTLAVSASTPTRVAAVVPALRSVSLGNTHGCGITAANEVYCWGDSDEGQGGTGVAPGSHSPELVASLTAQVPVSVSAGTDHVCAIIAGNNIACWGSGTLFRLGYNASQTCDMATAGPIPCQMQPNDLQLDFAAAVTAGHEHSCMITTFGDVRCWGSNDQGQGGAAPSTMQGLTVVPAISSPSALVTGRHHTCAIVGGVVSCWGSSNLYQLGSAIADSFTPVAVTLSAPAVALATNPLGRTTCALLDDGTVTCWGANDFGQLGRGTMSTRELPAPFVVPCD